MRWSRLARAHDRPRLLTTALSYEASADELSFVVGPTLVGLLTPTGHAAPAVAVVALLLGATLPFTLRHTDDATVPRRPAAAAGGSRCPAAPWAWWSWP